MFAFLSIFTVLILIYIVSTVIKPKGFPPGLRWYPFFGCFSIISSRIRKHGSQWKVLSEMAKEFSTNVLGLKLGNDLVVVVFGEKNIRRVMTEKEFDARPVSFFLRLRTFVKRVGLRWYPFFGCFSIISSRIRKHGSQWKVLSEMAKEFSTNVLGLKLGNDLVVVVFGEKNIRRVMTEKEFDARPVSFFLRLRTFVKRVGPTWFPLFGCSRLVEKYTKAYGSQWKGLSHLAKEYSTQVLGIKLGFEPIVVVFGERNVRRVFTEREFEGRPNSFFIRLRCLGKKMGITFADGELWREHRQFTLKHLKNVGFGKTAMEAEIKKELEIILNYIERHKSKPINPKTILAMSVMNILWKFTAGERIEEDRLNFLLHLLNERSKAFSMAGGWLNQWPWIRFLLPDLSGYTLINKMNQQISDIIEDAIAKHKSQAIRGEDFIYSFLEEIGGEHKESFTEEQLKIICLDILIAGSQTTSNVLVFAILTVLRNNAIQEKIFDEINNTIGKETPSYTDSTRLVYTTAFLLEVQRYFTIVPIAGPRRVLEDVIMDGYSIPKDTTILIGVGDVHFDPENWVKPDKFIPERFIDDQGNIKNTEHIFPFGSGRRRCPGDSLAKSFIFTVFVGIIQNYRIQCSNGVLPSEEPIIGMLSSARPYTAEFVARH